VSYRLHVGESLLRPASVSRRLFATTQSDSGVWRQKQTSTGLLTVCSAMYTRLLITILLQLGAFAYGNTTQRGLQINNHALL
jgi:hypothetical protein